MKFSPQNLLLATSVTMTMVHADKYTSQQRKLLEAMAPSQDTLEKCAQEEYTLYLGFVEESLGFLAKPTAQQQDCPTLAFHAIHTEEDNLVKIAHIYADDQDEVKLELGSYALERILQAHTVAPAGSFEDKYSFFNNNEGSFLINMGEGLGIDSNTPYIVGFVQEQLTTETTLPMVMDALYHEEEGVEMIENHFVEIENPFGKIKSEKEIVDDFVSSYIQDHSHLAATTTEEDMLLLVEESGAISQVSSMVAGALVTAAGAFVMLV